MTSAIRLMANEGLAHMGVKLHGDGFIVEPAEAAGLGLGRVSGLEEHVRLFLNGRDLADRPRGVLAIDLFGLAEDEVRQKFPTLFQRVFDRVRPERAVNNREVYRRLWWVFGEPRRELRPALHGLARFIATTRTAKHRVFQFVEQSAIAESKIVVVASPDAYALGVLSSGAHVTWALRAGGWLGVGNDPTYNHSDCFDPFPFPAATDPQKGTIRALGEELDGLRKKVIAQHDFLTITKLYNVREKLRAGAPLDESEKAIHDAGCIGVIHELHNKIDAAVAEAYGWPADLSDEDILARLVALNRERAEEERNGLVRWLRPEYQIPRFGARRAAKKEEQIEAELAAPEEAAPSLPKDDAALISVLRRTLRVIGKPAEPIEIAARFREGRKAAKRVERGLQLLAAAGVARRAGGRWFVADRAA